MADMELLTFPLLCFSEELVYVVHSAERLTTCSRVAFRSGYFRDLLLVDTTGRAIRVTGATNPRILWRYWRSVLFANPLLRVELVCASEAERCSVEDVRKRVLRSFSRWHGWSSRGDFEELRARVRQASSIAELTRLLDDAPEVTKSR